MAIKKAPSQKKRPARNKRKRPAFFNIPRLLLSLFIQLCVWGAVIGGMVALWFMQELPDLDRLHGAVRSPSITIQSDDGTVLCSYGDFFDEMVQVNDLPAYVPQALMAVEDRRFYYHFGVDFIGLIRAAYANYKAKRVVQGGSTLTQQLAKNFLITEGTFDTNDRSYKRKILEVLLSVWLEWKFTKNQILTMYINRVYFGSGTYGIEAAAQRYFNKTARELTVFESAMLAGLLKAPSKYSPTSHPKRARDRAAVVLDAMEDAGFIHNAKYYLKLGEIEYKEHANNYSKNNNSRYFCDWVREVLPNIVDVNQDLVVVTTLDPKMQDFAEVACHEKWVEYGTKFKVSQYALVAMQPDGAVRAMVGGRDYFKSQFNRALAQRQPGSTFKIFIYLAALEQGMTPDSLVDDGPLEIGSWKPKNYFWTSQGEIPLSLAFAKSVNTATIRICQEAGVENVIKAAQRLGISSPMLPTLSISLGAMEVTLLELTSAFATFSNEGRAVWPYGIIEVRNKKGDILYQYRPPASKQIVREEALRNMRFLLRNAVENGTARALNFSSTTSGKSGSNGDRDAWFVGYREPTDEPGFSDVVVGAWVGNDNNTPMAKRSTGGRMPAQIVKTFMQGPKALSKIKAKEEKSPKDHPKKVEKPQEKPKVARKPNEKAPPAKKKQNLDDLMANF